MIATLIDAGAYAPTRDEFGRDALDAAATPEVASFIREKARNQYLAEKLHRAFALGPELKNPDVETIRQIAASDRAAFTTRNGRGDCPLTILLEYINDRKRALLAIIRQAGVPLDALDYAGMTPLHRAVLDANPHEVADWVKLGLNPNAPDARGISALELAEGVLDTETRAKIIGALQSGER